jgi:ABC-type amino acid transport substrate-binding protein
MFGTSRTAYLVKSLVALVLVAAVALGADDSPPAAKKVTYTGDPVPAAALAKVIKQQTGIDVDVSSVDASKRVRANFNNVPFWTAVETLAEQTGSQVLTSGGRVALKPLKPGPGSPSHVNGPFRFAVRETNARGDLQAGTTTYDLKLDVCWEPRLNTYRIDSVPKITTAKDDTGKTVSVAAGGARTFTSGNVAELSVRPIGLTRESKKLTLSGSVTITMADELLTFTFDAAKPGGALAQKGVRVTVVKFGSDGADWFAEVELRYPPGGATWESNEYYWARNNEMRLLPPSGDPIKADRTDFGEGTIRYIFKKRATQVGAGWKFDYRTPGPMREVVVPFELKEIPLP